MEPLGRRYRSLREAVADEIRSGILDGTFAPGERLVEDEVARQLGVSRMPVREAFTILEAEGFIEIVPRRGASVAILSASEALELFEVRSTLEGLAARLAARRAEADSLDLLRSIIEEGKGAVELGNTHEMPHLHQRFHLELARAGKNQYLIELLSPLPAKIEWIYATVVRARAPVSWPEHAEIVEAILSGDEEKAEGITRLHVEDSAREFLAMLEQAESSVSAEH